VTRTEDEARARAEELIARIEGGARFADVAREASDAASSGPRGGLLGTYAPDEWPEAHAAIAPRLASLRVGEMSEALHAPYGWVIAERCPIELAHTRHVLIRFAGARNAPPELTRSRGEARAAIDVVRAELLGGADFAALARERSEDGSAERGGDVGTLGRGRMAEAYELAAFALAENELSVVVETEFGFHVIQRLPR
jgi:peptidyl-prolyl cis-trans isomerase SurA